MSDSKRPRRGAAIAADEQRRQRMAEINNDNNNTPPRVPKRPRNAAIKPQAKRPKVNNTPKVNKIKVLKNIYELMNSKDIEDYIAYVVLFNLVQDAPEVFIGKVFAVENLIEKIKKLKEVIKNATVNKTTVKQTVDVDLNNEQAFVLFFLIWLDGSHDKYIETTFIEWLLNSDFSKLLKGNEISTKIGESSQIINNILSLFKSPNSGIKRIQNNYGTDYEIKGTVPWESIIKLNLHYIFGGSKPFEQDLDTININTFFKKKDTTLGLFIDQEGDTQPISKLIGKSKGLKNILRIKPVCNIGNFLDPGRKVKGEGYFQEIAPLFSMEVSRNSFDMQTFKINFKLPTKLLFSVDIEIKPNKPPVSKDEGYKNLEFFDVNVNDEKILVGITAAQANMGDNNKKLPNHLSGTKKYQREIGKFFGDFTQVLVTSQISKSTAKMKPPSNRSFATGDGSASQLYYYISKLIKSEPKIVLDAGGTVSKTIMFYGLNDIIQKTYLPSPSQVTRGQQSYGSGYTPRNVRPIARVNNIRNNNRNYLSKNGANINNSRMTEFKEFLRTNTRLRAPFNRLKMNNQNNANIIGLRQRLVTAVANKSQPNINKQAIVKILTDERINPRVAPVVSAVGGTRVMNLNNNNNTATSGNSGESIVNTLSNNNTRGSFINLTNKANVDIKKQFYQAVANAGLREEFLMLKRDISEDAEDYRNIIISALSRKNIKRAVMLLRNFQP